MICREEETHIGVREEITSTVRRLCIETGAVLGPYGF
jgi:hypothetical protein